MDKILEILEKEGLTSLEFDLTVGPELYVRTRIERGGNRGRAYYFVRSGDTAERGEGACPDEAFAKILKELVDAAVSGEPAATSHRLAVNDGGQTSALTAGQPWRSRWHATSTSFRSSTISSLIYADDYRCMSVRASNARSMMVSTPR